MEMQYCDPKIAALFYFGGYTKNINKNKNSYRRFMVNSETWTQETNILLKITPHLTRVNITASIKIGRTVLHKIMVAMVNKKIFRSRIP